MQCDSTLTPVLQTKIMLLIHPRTSDAVLLLNTSDIVSAFPITGASEPIGPENMLSNCWERGLLLFFSSTILIAP